MNSWFFALQSALSPVFITYKYGPNIHPVAHIRFLMVNLYFLLSFGPYIYLVYPKLQLSRDHWEGLL